MIPNLGGGEFILLLIIAFFVLGPSKLPEYAAALARTVRKMRDMAEGAKTQIRDEMGPAFDDVDWQQLDPRQYDPRRIVREALAAPSEQPKTTAEQAGMVPVDVPPPDEKPKPARKPAVVRRPRERFDPDLPTPFDVDAT